MKAVTHAQVHLSTDTIDELGSAAIDALDEPYHTCHIVCWKYVWTESNDGSDLGPWRCWNRDCSRWCRAIACILVTTNWRVFCTLPLRWGRQHGQRWTQYWRRTGREHCSRLRTWDYHLRWIFHYRHPTNSKWAPKYKWCCVVNLQLDMEIWLLWMVIQVDMGEKLTVYLSLVTAHKSGNVILHDRGLWWSISGKMGSRTETIVIPKCSK